MSHAIHIAVLIENTIENTTENALNCSLTCEHGLSLLIEYAGKRILLGNRIYRLSSGLQFEIM